MGCCLPNASRIDNFREYVIILLLFVFGYQNLRGENVAIQVNISDDKIDNLSTSAQKTLKKQVEKYADDIIKEANLIEEAIREDGANTEITSNIILQAVRKNKTNHRKKSNKGLFLAKCISTFTLLFTGYLFDLDRFKSNAELLIVFLIVFVIASISTLFQFLLEDKE